MYNFGVAETFKENPVGFTAKTTNQYSSGPCVIAKVATSRLAEGVSIELPTGYTNENLENVYWMNGYYDREVGVSGRQARELRKIGVQLLSLNQEGKIQPPLAPDEIASIEYMHSVVEAVEARYQKVPEGFYHMAP